jgi:hypothetical protein
MTAEGGSGNDRLVGATSDECHPYSPDIAVNRER